MEYAAYPGPHSIPDMIGAQWDYIPYQYQPEWCGAIDCRQVGYNIRGEIVAYDYGIH